MPKVLSYTPAWLSRPSPGYQLFTPRATENGTTNEASPDSGARGAQRTIAYRGSEIFVAVGNEIRWTDLVMLSEKPRHTRRSSQGPQRSARAGSNAQERAHRVLKVPGSGKIKNLVVSPNGDYLAISTSHTVHIAIIPDSNHLGVSDDTPLKMKTFQLGPTVHVLEQSPIASILWHPLGALGHCVVTVTREGAIRLWDIDRDDRSSFGEPSLAISLQKLASAQTAAEDTRASVYSSGRAFSVDSPDLDVASASFGASSGFEDGHFWPAMTLWIATAGGELYALCPLLPRRWQVNRSLSRPNPLQTFADSINANMASKDDRSSRAELRDAQTQAKWLTEIHEQIPTKPKDTPLGVEASIYRRPSSKTPEIPKLQGPFELSPEIDLFDDISDLLVAPLHHKEVSAGFDDDEESDIEDDSIPGSLIYISTTSGLVHVCIEMAGVEGKWLPARRSRDELEEAEDVAALFVIDSVTLPSADGQIASLPLTPDVRSNHAIYIAHPHGVFYLSVAQWVQKLLAEIEAAELIGSDVRLNNILEGPRTFTDLLLQLPAMERNPQHMTTPLVLEDADLGYFVLFVADHQPFAASLDIPDSELAEDTRLLTYDDGEQGDLNTSEARLAYQPSNVFYRLSRLQQTYNDAVPSRQRRAFSEEIRLSPAVLDVLTAVHRVLSNETHQLGLAAADLFRRCERLQVELREQIVQTSEVHGKIDNLVGGDEDNDSGFAGNMMVNGRIENAKEKQRELLERFEAIKLRMSRVGGQQLSKAEQDYAAEVQQLERSVDPNADADDDGPHEIPIWKRTEEVLRLKADLTQRAQEATKLSTGGSHPAEGQDSASPLKQQRLRNVEGLIQRQTAMMESVHGQLSRLSMQ